MPFCGNSAAGWGPASSLVAFDVTPCFAQAILQVLPSLVLCTVGVARLVYVYKRPSRYVPTLGLKVKLVAYALLVALSIAQLAVAAATLDDGSAVFSAVLSLVAMVLASALSYLEHVKYDVGSMMLTTFWILKTIACAISLRTYLNHGMDRSSSYFVVYCLVTGTSLAMLLTESLWSTKAAPGLTPETHASPAARLTFMWLNRLMHLGSKQVITMDDIYKCGEKMESSGLYADYTRIIARLNEPVPLAFWALLRRHGVSFAMSNFCVAALLVLQFLLPVLLDRLIMFVESYVHGPPQPVIEGYTIAVAILLVSMMQSIMQQQSLHLVIRLSVRIQATFMNIIYRKAMRLSLAGKKNSSTGAIVNHMSVDAGAITDCFSSIPDTWSSPVSAILALYFLWGYLGPASLCGLAVIVLLTPIMTRLTAFLMPYQKLRLGHMDRRMKTMSEVIPGMKMIKLYATESYFLNRISKIRGQEQDSRRIFLTGISAVNGVARATPILMAVASFAVYSAIAPADKPLNTQRIFVSVSYFNILNAPMSSIMNIFASFSNGVASYRRLSQFMRSTEIDPNAVTINRQASDDPIAASIERGEFTWNGPQQEEEQKQPNKKGSKANAKPVKDTTPSNLAVPKDIESSSNFSLSNINITVQRGELTAVVGRVGQGKTALLHALLGEMIKTDGRVVINGTVAYVAQAAWIINGTVRDNITMGAEFNEKRYQETMAACSLLPDMEVLGNGDLTLIGDKGVNLSGGQKARVSLARAVYANADVYLLDDCLSAVDAHVDKHIFNNVIGKQGMLAGKSVILVTHGVHHLPQCDRVVLLREGRVVEQGTYRQLMDARGDVYALVTEYSLKQKAEEDDEGEVADRDDSVQVMARTGSDRTLVVPEQDLTDAKKPSKDEAPAAARVASKMPNRADDDNTTGSVDWAVYRYYFTAMGFLGLGLFIALQITYGASLVADRMWLEHISEGNQNGHTLNMAMALGVYGIIAVMQIVTFSVASYWFQVKLSIRAARLLHERLLARIFRAPTMWLDSMPAGRILNRFSSDTNSMDMQVPMTIGATIALGVSLVAQMVNIIQALPWMAIVLVVALISLGFVQHYYLNSSRELKRIESGSKAPIYQLFGESIEGVVTIRAYHQEERFIEQLEGKIDRYIRAYYINFSSNRWLGIMIGFIGSFIVFGVALISVITRGPSTGASVGVGITSAQGLVMAMTWLVRVMCMLEANMVAIERIRNYSRIEMEAAEHDANVEVSWPATGAITFNGYTTAYKPTSPPVLQDLNVSIRGGEKIGICGRTGAGKSTITLSLFRIIEATAGSIEIDGQDISKVGLADLRSRLTIIPQDPVLFQGTIRDNLDPLNKHDDAAVWRALEQANLKDYVSTLDGGLETKVDIGGSNFSAGQKQLLTMACALLKKQRIVVFDEATSATDAETDTIVQRTIRSEFGDCTVLTIAHRIATIMDSDRILVLDRGQVVEFDTPGNLLQNPESAFAKLVQSTTTH
ncbi:hypothetical protein RI367_007314 [Sorochytrium milnesiophthora]